MRIFHNFTCQLASWDSWWLVALRPPDPPEAQTVQMSWPQNVSYRHLAPELSLPRLRAAETLKNVAGVGTSFVYFYTFFPPFLQIKSINFRCGKWHWKPARQQSKCFCDTEIYFPEVLPGEEGIPVKGNTRD